MSPTNEYGPQVKKRKKDRACDGCRRRKTKCDGPWMPENVCTNCTHTRKPCTYVEASKPRGPPKAYVTGLEDKLETLEALLQQIRPDVDFSEELGPPVIRGSWKTEIEQSSSSSSVSLTRKPSLLPPILIPFDPQPRDSISSTSLVIPSPRTTHLLFRSQPRSKRTRGADATLPPWLDGSGMSDDESTTGPSSSSSDTEELVITSIRGRNKFTLKASEADDPSNESNIRFHGRSSTAGLVETTRIFKHMHMRETMTSLQQDASSPTAPDNNVVAQTRRPQFWSTPRWETLSQDTSIDCPSHLPTFLRYFPPPDLAGTLIDLYFRHSNLLFPLLHRPTFEKQWRERLQRRNIWFACVCILVFAVASRWCDDERVLPEDARLENGELDWRRAGRHYFALGVEIHRVRKNFFHPASLFEVQTFTLLGMYMRGTDVFPSAWQCISVGVRKAQDVGAHRKKVYHRGKPNADDELWKRAFWHLVVFDRIGGASLGRACGIPEEDFDVDLPLEVDDEYWENGEEPFKQPPGVPSSVTAFNQFIKLTQIMAFTTRTLYAIDKTKVYRGLVPLDQKSLVQQLSSAMNDWLEACPPHLKWHNDIDNPMLSNQSTTIYTTYYLTQMLIHRPLIASAASPPPTPAGNPYPSNFPPPVSPLPNPAIVVCTNAARSCARIVEILLQRGTDFFHVPNIINVAYVCAGSLLLSVWNMKGLEKDLRDRGLPDIKPPLAQVIEEQLADAKIFLRALELVRPRWDVVDLLLKELRQSLPGFDSEGILMPPSSYSSSSKPETTHANTTRKDHGYSSFGSDQSAAARTQPFRSSTLRTSPLEDAYHPSTMPLPRHRQKHHPTELHSFSNTEPVVHIRLPQNVPAQPPDSQPAQWPPRQPFGDYQFLSSHPHPAPPPPISSGGGGRTRAISTTGIPVAGASTERPLPYISSSMRRTSFPNLSAREAYNAYEDGRYSYARTQLSPSEPSVQSNAPAMKRDDINMHFENEYTSTPRHLQHHQYHDQQQQPPSKHPGSRPPTALVDKRGHRMEAWNGLPARPNGHGSSPGFEGWNGSAPPPPGSYSNLRNSSSYGDLQTHAQGAYGPWYGS